MFKYLWDRFFAFLAKEIGPHITPYITVNNGKANMPLNQGIQSNRRGGDEQMAVIEAKASRLYSAAQAGRWEWATRLYLTLTKKLRSFATANPKYAAHITEFLKETCQPMGAAIRAQDWPEFQSCWREFKEQTDYQHERNNFGYIVVDWPDASATTT